MVNKPLISTAGSTRSPLRWEFENPFTTRAGSIQLLKTDCSLPHDGGVLFSLLAEQHIRPSVDYAAALLLAKVRKTWPGPRPAFGRRPASHTETGGTGPPRQSLTRGLRATNPDRLSFLEHGCVVRN